MAITKIWIEENPDLSKCPKCGGPADNGHSRDLPPSPYLCTKCSGSKQDYSEPHI